MDTKSAMSGGEDIHYDEANPQFRFLFNSTHCLTILKYILVVHIATSVIVSLYLMPYSIVVAPIFVIVLGTGVFSLKSHDHLALLPFQTYLFISFLSASVASIVCPIVVFISKHHILGHFGFHRASSHFVTLMLVLNIMLVNLVLSGLLYWQWSVCVACREYYRRIREQTDYVHLSVPDSFVNGNAAEQQPFVGKKSADYMVFTLDQVNLDDSTDDERPKKDDVKIVFDEEKNKI